MDNLGYVEYRLGDGISLLRSEEGVWATRVIENGIPITTDVSVIRDLEDHLLKNDINENERSLVSMLIGELKINGGTEKSDPSYSPEEFFKINLSGETNIEFSYVIDYSLRTLHLMDMDRGMTLTNAFPRGMDTFVEIARGIDGVVKDWEWIIYHTDGIISEYNVEKDEFYMVGERVKLYPPFVESMKERYEGSLPLFYLQS